MLTLKNISSIDALSFFRWITALRYWQKYLDQVAEHHPLLNHQSTGPAQPYIEVLTETILDNLRKASQAMSLPNLLLELTRDYVEVFHKVIMRKFRTPATTKSSTLFRKTLGNQLKSLPSFRRFCRTYLLPKAAASMHRSPFSTLQHPQSGSTAVLLLRRVLD